MQTYKNKIDKGKELDANLVITESSETKSEVQDESKLESIFGHSLTNNLNGENQVVSKSSAVTTADASDKRQQPSDSTLCTSTLATTVTADGNFNM
nr:hypothetical protein [Tanacetum cinerariifolium]